MKIGINCADLDHDRIDGTRVYIKNVLNHLGEMAPEDEFFLYHKTDFNPELLPKMHPNYVERKIPYPFWWTQTRLAFEAQKDKIDVLWMPIQQVPFLVAGKMKTVITIHDLAWKYFPQAFPFKDGMKLDFFTQTAVKRANKIIAVSHSTKKDILKFYPKVEEIKVEVVYHGIEKVKSQKSKVKSLSIISKFKIQNSKFILYVGAIQPRKNLGVLVEAFEKLKEDAKLHSSVETHGYVETHCNASLPRELKLVLAGATAWKPEETLERIRKSKFSNDIILTGKVSFEDLQELYQNAAVFVFPSLYEGFGLPVLEAMRAGVPTVVANNSSLPEVAGEAAERFEAGNPEDLKNILQELLQNENKRKELIEKGHQRVRQFSWEKCARETLDVLKN